MQEKRAVPPRDVKTKRGPSAGRISVALTALFAAAVATLALLWGKVDDASERDALLFALFAMAAYGAATGFLAFRAGRRIGALSEHAPTILSALSVGVILTDASFKVLHANPAFARMVGRELEAVPGTLVREFIYPADRAVFGVQTARRRAGGEDTYKVRLEGAGGRPVHVLITARPLMRDGKFAGAIGLIQDLSETMNARAEAAEARNLSGFLFDAFTHDLSNSLQVVLGRLAAASALARAGNPRAAQATEAAVAAAERTARELREIKQIARAEKGGAGATQRGAGELVQEAIAVCQVDPTVAVLTDMPAGPALATVRSTELGPLALSKLIEEAAARGVSQAPRTVTVELRHGELGPSTVVVRVRG